MLDSRDDASWHMGYRTAGRPRHPVVLTDPQYGEEGALLSFVCRCVRLLLKGVSSF